MITARSLIFAAMTAAPLYASPASAHVLLDLKEATVGGALRVAFQVPHGCDGSPTVNLAAGTYVVENGGWNVGGVRGYDFMHDPFSETGPVYVPSGRPDFCGSMPRRREGISFPKTDRTFRSVSGITFPLGCWLRAGNRGHHIMVRDPTCWGS